jgi:hypothetical protein
MGKFEFRAHGNIFRGDEELTYFGANLVYGMGNGFALGLNFGTANTKSHNFGATTIRSGGRDIELQGRYSVKEVPGLTLAGGVSFPNTPAQDQTFFTGRAIYGVPFEKGNAYFGFAGVFRGDSSITALTFGVESELASGFSLLGEVNAVVSGNNTFDRNGNAQRVSTYGVGVRYRQAGAEGSPSFMLGWGNSLGSTTGYSLSPGLNKSGAFFLGVSFSK